MKPMNQRDIIRMLLAVIAVLVVLFVIMISNKPKAPAGNAGAEAQASSSAAASGASAAPSQSAAAAPKATPASAPVSISGVCGMQVTSPAEYGSVAFPLTVKGVIDQKAFASAGCAWNVVEGKAGTAQLYYYLRGAWQSTGVAVPVTTSGTTVASTSAFSASLNLYPYALGLAAGAPLKIVFTDQASPAIPDQRMHSFEYLLYVK